MSLTAAELRAIYVVDEGPLDRSLAGIPGKVGKVKPSDVKIDGDDKGLQRAATSAETRMGQLSSTMKTQLGAIAGYFAFDQVIRFFGDSIDAASDLSETVNKSNTIFGQNAAVVNDWAQDSARSVGLSRQAALDAAAGFGDMFSQIGFTGDEAARLSTQVVQMSADLGSFNNMPTADVADKISAAFRGEYDSLQALIPNINAARVEQEAMAATGKSNAAELTAQEKAAAVLAIVNKDGARAMGDFARTSDGAANSSKIAAAEWANAKAKLGDLLVGPMTAIVQFSTGSLIPAFEAVVGVVGVFVDFIGAIPGPVQAAIVVLTALSLLSGPIATGMATMGTAVQGFAARTIAATSSITAAKAAASGLMGLFGGPWGVALAAAAAAYVVVKQGQDQFEESSRNAAVELQAAADLYGKAAVSAEDLGERLAAEAGFWDGVAASRSGANEALQESGGFVDGLNTASGGALTTILSFADAMSDGELAADGFSNEIERQAGELGAYGAQGEAASEATRKLNDLIAEGVTSGPEYEAAVKAAAEAQSEHEATTDASAAAVDNYRGKTDEATASAEAQKEALDRLKSSLDQFLGIAISAAEAQLDVADGLADIATKAAESGTSLDRNTQAGRDNERAILDQITAIGDLAQATFEQTGSSDAAKDAFNRERDALRNKLLEIGYNEAAVDSLIATYGQIPNQVWTDIQASTRRADETITEWLGRRRTIQVHVALANGTPTVIGGGPTERAEGGRVWPGKTFLVGEEGPELVQFGASGYVTPAGMTAQLMSMGNQQAAAGLSARVPTGAVPPRTTAPAAGAQDGATAGGIGELVHIDNYWEQPGSSPQANAQALATEIRTRPWT